MDPRTGKRIRAGQLFDARSGRAIVVALSHGILLGPSHGMGSLGELRTMAASLRSADALMLAPGLVGSLEDAFVGRDRPALIVHADWQSASRGVFRRIDASGAVVAPDGVATVAAATTATAEDAAAAGAIGVMTFLYAGFDDAHLERDEIARNGAMARACERAGILHMIEPRSARERVHAGERRDAAVGAYLARIAAEIGADIVKVIHPGSREGLARVVEGCPAPVLLAGGAEAEDEARGAELAADAMATGCRGLVFGRAIARAADPAAALARYRAIVHGDA